MDSVDPETAYRKGLSITKAMSHDRRSTKILLFASLKRLWQSVRVGEDKTWRSDEDLRDCVDDIVDVYRTMKLEEVLIVMQDIRRGKRKIYGRLDTPTILEALQDHDANVTTSYRTRQHTSHGDMIPAHLDKLKMIADEMPIQKPTLQEICNRPSQIPEDERQAMRNRDRERRNNQAQGQT